MSANLNFFAERSSKAGDPRNKICNKSCDNLSKTKGRNYVAIGSLRTEPMIHRDGEPHFGDMNLRPMPQAIHMTGTL